MRFSLVHLIPNPQLHGLYGYLEVMETIRWGLVELGHDVAVKTNRITGDVINILFGHQMLDDAAMNALPADTIVYNLEQLANATPEQIKRPTHIAAQRLTIWDYSPRNIAAIDQLRPAREVVHVPIGWSPTLGRIGKRADEDIDVLFYGLPTAARLDALTRCIEKCLKVVYACGLYGQARDELIARSKVVLNVNAYEKARVFELVRVSYLLANGKAVVSDVYPESDVDEDVKSAVAFAPLEQVADACAQLVDNESARRRLEVVGPEVMKRRDIRPILRAALERSGIR
jgi:hypothetical protein